MNRNIDLFRIKVGTHLITCLIENGESFRRGKRGLIQTGIFQGDGGLIGQRSGKLDLVRLKRMRFVLIDENQARADLLRSQEAGSASSDFVLSPRNLPSGARSGSELAASVANTPARFLQAMEDAVHQASAAEVCIRASGKAYFQNRVSTLERNHRSTWWHPAHPSIPGSQLQNFAFIQQTAQGG